MGVLLDALKALRFVSLQGQPLTGSAVAAWLDGGSASATGVSVSPDSALGVTAVWDCVDLISSDVARTPLHLYRRMGDDREAVSALPGTLQYLLEERPNPYMTAFDFRKALEAHKLLRGNAFAEIERDGNGAIVALWVLNPARMGRPQESEGGTLVYPYQTSDGRTVQLRQEQVFHIRGYTDDGIWGKSPITVHRETVGLALAQKEYTARFYGNNANPSGYLSLKAKLTSEAQKRLKTAWEEAHRGLSNAHRVAVLEEGVEWHQVGMNNEDAQFLETNKFTRIEIASIFHVPPHKIGEMDRATFSNIAEQSEAYVSETLDAEYANWEAVCNAALLMPSQLAGFFIEFLRNALVRTTIDKRFESYDRAWWMTPNEIRARENLNRLPQPEMDEIILPVNRMPLSLMMANVASNANAQAMNRRLMREADGYQLIEEPHHE